MNKKKKDGESSSRKKKKYKKTFLTRAGQRSDEALIQGCLKRLRNKELAMAHFSRIIQKEKEYEGLNQ